jgi:hypothetical protein
MTVIGITGTDGAGEKVSKHFRKTLPDILGGTNKNIDKVYSFCKKRVTVTVPAA